MINKLVLVTMPFIRPTSPPLGIANLKSYIENNSNTKVRCLDLNILFHIDFLGYLRKIKGPNKREKIMIGFYDFIKNKDNLNDIEKLNYNITEFLEGFEDVKDKAEIICKDFIEGKRRDLSLMERYAQMIIDEKPDILGFSICYRENFITSLAMAKMIKRLSRGLKIIFGGPYVSLVGEELFNITGKVVDYIVYNQGEKALLELMRGTNPEDIPNLIYKKEGKIIRNKEEIILDLGQLEYVDFSDFSLENYFTPFPVLPVFFSKGCYWRKCTFCVHHRSYSNIYLAKNVDKFIGELVYYNKKYGVRHFYFVDEMISSINFEKIADSIIQEGLDIFYYALAKPTKDFSFDVFKKMYDSGCRCLLLGIESGNQRILNLMKKGTTVEEMEIFLRLNSKAGIKNCCFFILGFPSESLNELEDTKRFIIRNRKAIELIFYGKFILEKNSSVFLNPNMFGIKIKNAFDGIGQVYDYESIDGLDVNSSVYNEVKKFLSEINGNKQGLTYLRDIMLMFYSKD